jgi:Tfp pilus assembly protein PilX
MRESRPRWSDERGSVLVLALFIMALLMATGIIMLRMSTSETDIAYNAVWSEGAFYAAEAAIAVGIDQLGPTLVADVAMAAAPLTTDYNRMGNVQFLGATQNPGYALSGMPTYSNAAGFYFNQYRIAGTGTGPRNAQRQVEIQASFGPVQ